jgi:hypothetical protein
MFCPKCGKQLKENAKFCVYCGEQVEHAPLEDAPVPEVSNISEGGQIPGGESDVNISPAADSHPPESGDEPTSTIVSPSGGPEVAPLTVSTPQNRRNRGWGGVIVAAILCTLFGTLVREGVQRIPPLASGAPGGTSNTDSSAVQSSWIDYTPTDGTFTVRLPSSPEHQTTPTTYLGISLKYETYTAYTGDELPICTVVVYKLPGDASLITETQAQSSLGGMVGGMANTAGWSSLSESEITTADGFFTKAST